MLAGVADKDTQEKLATECIEKGWTVRELEKAIASLETNKKAEKKIFFFLDIFIFSINFIVMHDVFSC